ncbi:hypothetical protein FM107_01220 [Sphingobacterium sp. JB170]|nr:hypothetical protein FM107_01220 [Sphingobacterium sp. JB170]
MVFASYALSLSLFDKFIFCLLSCRRKKIDQVAIWITE